MHRMFLHFCLEFSSMIAEYRYREKNKKELSRQVGLYHDKNV